MDFDAFREQIEVHWFVFMYGFYWRNLGANIKLIILGQVLHL
jgi:hypothetical protein